MSCTFSPLARSAPWAPNLARLCSNASIWGKRSLPGLILLDDSRDESLVDEIELAFGPEAEEAFLLVHVVGDARQGLLGGVEELAMERAPERHVHAHFLADVEELVGGAVDIE